MDYFEPQSHEPRERSGKWGLEWYQDIVKNEGKIALK